MPSRHRPQESQGRQVPPPPPSGPPREPAPEDTIRTETIQIERKSFIFSLRENPRGRFLRITEDVMGRRDHIIIPASGLEEFRRVIDDLARVSAETPLKAQP